MAKTINIMTSSDANLLKYIAIQLQSIHENINDRPVNFFLLHSGIKDENLKKLYVQCDAYDNISFNDIEIEESEGFRLLTKLGGGWNDAAYYPLLAHRYLPNDIDRILYIDAGDTFAASNPSPYYDAAFQGNVLTVTPIRFKVTPEGNLTLYSESDLSNKYLLPGILRGLMNSGSYVINLKMMRTLDFGINDYTGLALALSRVLGKEEHVYWGDQGLLSAAFTGQMNVFGFPEYKDLFYMPHNFCMWYFDTKSVKSMAGIFSYCKSLKSIDLKNFETSSLENMAVMFLNCSSIKTLELNNFDTKSVTNFHGLFKHCSSLTDIFK